MQVGSLPNFIYISGMGCHTYGFSATLVIHRLYLPDLTPPPPPPTPPPPHKQKNLPGAPGGGGRGV